MTVIQQGPVEGSFIRESVMLIKPPAESDSGTDAGTSAQ